MKDLSLTGCYILTPTQLELGRRTDVELCLCVNGDSLRAPARILLVRPESGAAFEFLPGDPQMRTALLALIQKLAAELISQEAAKSG
jgi:PilZ domain